MNKNELDLSGLVFGRLKIISKAERRLTKGGHLITQWLCECLCGNKGVFSTASLSRGNTQSCGCLLKEFNIKTKTSHGYCSPHTPLVDKIKFVTLSNIQRRASINGYESDLEICDLPNPPNICPVLGIPLVQNRRGKNLDSSPSIDRKNPSLLYLKKHKDNLIYISHKANTIKQDASLVELEKVLDYMQGRLIETECDKLVFNYKPLLASIKDRARRRGYECDLDLEDFPVVTKKCPVFGVEYERNFWALQPSIDRMNSNLPYLKKYKDNLRFISRRANVIKSNANEDELKKVIAYIRAVS